MAGGEGRRLIQEEQLRESAWAKQLAAAALELEPARDPPTTLPAPDQAPMIVVQDTSIAEQ